MTTCFWAKRVQKDAFGLKNATKYEKQAWYIPLLNPYIKTEGIKINKLSKREIK